MTTTGRIIPATRVAPATDPLPEVRYPEAVAALLNEPLRRQREDVVRELADAEDVRRYKDGPWLTEEIESCRARLAELATAEARIARPVEACSRYHGALVAGVINHPVIEALHAAFCDHRPVRLTPDVAWLMICQGVANHVRQNAGSCGRSLSPTRGRSRSSSIGTTS
jgi:hypothetical protein